MNQEELNAQLYEQVLAEQKAFTEHLLTLTPKEILDKASEYTVREDIVLSMEDSSLTPKQCKALLKSKTPLADIFDKISDWDNSGYMEMVADAVSSRANEVIRDSMKKSRGEAR